MPPRTIVQPCLRALNVASLEGSFSALSLNVCAPSSRAASSSATKRKHRSPFDLALARQRKAANLSRRRVLEEQRTAAVGDPVIGKPTPFAKSLEHDQPGAVALQESTPSSDHLNYFLTTEEFNAAVERSRALSAPVEDRKSGAFDPQAAKEAAEQHRKLDQNAVEALRRIVELNNGSSKDRSRVNIQRCIEEFGRHNTDKKLPPKPPAVRPPNSIDPPEKTPRVGPDTGSSEVQCAILTSKILNLAKQMERTGHKDKHNKRNLRLLVHRRQKLLAYLRRKERGGPRWQNLISQLGLTEASWNGEISM